MHGGRRVRHGRGRTRQRGEARGEVRGGGYHRGATGRGERREAGSRARGGEVGPAPTGRHRRKRRGRRNGNSTRNHSLRRRLICVKLGPKAGRARASVHRGYVRRGKGLGGRRGPAHTSVKSFSNSRQVLASTRRRACPPSPPRRLPNSRPPSQPNGCCASPPRPPCCVPCGCCCSPCCASASSLYGCAAAEGTSSRCMSPAGHKGLCTNEFGDGAPEPHVLPHALHRIAPPAGRSLHTNSYQRAHDAA